MEEITKQIVEWLQNQVKNAHADGLLVGLSGGLDSAVVTALIKRAFPNNSLAVIMPIKSNPNDMLDANAVVDTCEIKSTNIDLTESHQVLLDTTISTLKNKSLFSNDKLKLTDANLRARIRMSTLYAVASQLNYLVVGTDNAAEWHTGYFTKYGDGGADIQPIIDFTKREVQQLANYLKLPQSVIDKPPSADLWEGQTDETELGVTYQAIDDYLDGKEVTERDKQTIENLHRKTEHKRNIATQFNFK